MRSATARRGVTALVAAAALSIGALSAAAQAASAPGPSASDAAPILIRIRGVDLHRFPTVQITVAVQGAPGSAGAFALSENGRSATGVHAVSLRSTDRAVDVVLAIDTSNSMRGAPLASAVQAARDFVTNLPPDIAVGLVTFDRSPRVVSGVTTDHEAVLVSLSDLSTEKGTALYDAVARAAGMFTTSAQHTIVVLTDGADVGSRVSLEEAATAAANAKASIYAVGLESNATQVPPLQRLAVLTDGVYSPSAQADLARLYRNLATEIAQQYVLTYRSLAPRGQELSLEVRLGSASDTAVALAPALPATPEAPRPPARPLVHGTWGMVLAMGLTFGAIFLLLVMVLGTAARRRRERSLAIRMAVEDEQPDRPDHADRGLGGWIPDPILNAAGRMADAGGVSSSLDTKLEKAGLPIRAAEFVVATALAAVAGGLLGLVVFGHWMFGVAFAVLGAVVPSVLLPWAVGRRVKRLHGQLADTLMILASSLRAGHSFLQALDTVSKEIGEPAATEFGRVVSEIRLGRSVQDAMNAMAERVGSDDFKWAMLAVSIQREVGGNLAEILETVADTVRERDALRRQIEVLSSEGRFSIWILAALPFLVGAYIAKVNPGYFSTLFTQRLGQVMVVVAGCLMVLGIAWMKKIVRIDV